jgi:hypothetical protein
MRRIVLVSGVLGTGTVLVFALAALTATLFPQGTLVRTQWAGGWQRGMFLEEDVAAGGVEFAMPAPMPVPMDGDVFVPEK